MRKDRTLALILSAANLAALAFLYVVNRNLKSEEQRALRNPEGSLRVDLSGEDKIQVDFEKKMLPEFTIYQV